MGNPAGRRATLLLLVAALFGAGCAGVDSRPGELAVEVLHQGGQCGGEQPAAALREVADQAGLTAFYGRLGARQPGDRPAPPRVAFDRQRVVLLDMGQRATGGYSLALASPLARVEGDTARIQVQWREPAAGAMVSQVITSPCLLLVLPRAGYAALEVVDEDGRRRLRQAF